MTARVEIGWQHDDEDYRVRLRCTPGMPRPPGLYPGCSSDWVPADEDPEVEVLSVVEDRVGGAERPELMEAAQADLDPGVVADAVEEESDPWSAWS